MDTLKFTLIADGRSGRTLLRIIKWELDNLYPTTPNEGAYADFSKLRKPPLNLLKKVELALELYPFDILFVHRDAENNNKSILNERKNEIFKSIEEKLKPKTVCIVPIKMMEAWLLLEDQAIKKAAGNRNFKGQIALPKVSQLEDESQPKEKLYQLLKKVSGLKSRNLKKFNVNAAVHLVAEYTNDFRPLRQLSAFDHFEKNLKNCMQQYTNAK